MKKTKEVILETALGLFNNQGLSKVTLRTIANEMGISQGNLNYHFSKRDEIIESLYFQLVKNIDESFALKQEVKNSFDMLFIISKTIMTNFYEYRFVFLDFVQIMRDHPKVRAHYQKLSIEREGQCMRLFGDLINEGYLREPVLENEYQHLYKRMQIVADFWISSEMSTSSNLSKKMVARYSMVINENIFPYLTEKGRIAYTTTF